MKVSLLKKLLVAVIVTTMATPAVAASAATPATKKISVLQGKKIYDKAVKATKAWTAKNPHTKMVRNEDKSYPGQPVTTTVFTIDSNQNLFFDDSEEKIYIIGETLYAENIEGNLADYEVEIIEDLGLNLNAKYAVMHPHILDPSYNLEKLRAEFLDYNTEFSFTGDRNDAKTTTVTYRKSGSTEFLTVTLMFPAMFGSPAAKRVLNTKIERGIITSTIETNTSSDENFKVTTTFKPFNGAIAAPTGPYLEWDKVYLDPRYGKQTDEKIAGLILNSYVREVQALAAFDSLNTVTIETWKTLAEDENIMLYDKGVEFTYSNDGKKRACGVFTDKGAYLEMKPCEELGFTKI
jgi:hypothetical protein